MATTTAGNQARSEFRWGRTIRAGLVGIVAAAVLSTLYALVVNATVGPAMAPNPQGEVNAVAVPFYGIAAAVFTLVGAVLFTLMMRYGGQHAMRNFIIVALVGLVLSFGTVAQPGLDTSSRWILGIAHVVAALGAIPGMVLTYQRGQ